jgi:hypothetical protein
MFDLSFFCFENALSWCNGDNNLKLTIFLGFFLKLPFKTNESRILILLERNAVENAFIPYIKISFERIKA